MIGTRHRALVILFGGPGRQQVILALHAAGEPIRAVIVPDPMPARLSHALEPVERAGLHVVPVVRGGVRDVLAAHEDAQLLSIGFPFLLPADVLARFERPLNVHPTRLPEFRGPTTGRYVLMSGAQASGSTVHIIDAGMDTGPVVAQSRVPLTRFDTIRSMQRKVYASEPQLVLDALALIRRSGFAPTPQDESQASIFPKRLSPEDSELDPSRPLIELYDAIRACDPEQYPAYFVVDAQKVCIRLWRPERPDSDGEDML